MSAGRTAPGISGTILSNCYFTADQSVEILGGFNTVDLFKDSRGFQRHSVPESLVVFVRKLAAFVLKVEILDVAQDHFLFSLQQIPFGFFDDSGFQGIVLSE